MIQLDYTFLSTKGATGESTCHQTLLTLVDVRSQLAAATIVPHKCVSSYAIAEANIFLYEVGRTNAILQTDDETSTKALTKELARQICGLAVRVAPAGSKESQGSVERYHQTLHAQIRTLRLALAASYNINLVEIQSSHPILNGRQDTQLGY